MISLILICIWAVNIFLLLSSSIFNVQILLKKLDLQVINARAQNIRRHHTWPNNIEAHQNELHSHVGFLVSFEEGTTLRNQEELADHHESDKHPYNYLFCHGWRLITPEIESVLQLYIVEEQKTDSFAPNEEYHTKDVKCDRSWKLEHSIVESVCVVVEAIAYLIQIWLPKLYIRGFLIKFLRISYPGYKCHHDHLHQNY